MTSIYPSSTTSTTSSTSSANLLRISGMASGIDTDAVVKSMVSNYQAKIDKANQSKQTLQWQQEAYRGIIKDIKGLQDYFDPLSSKYILSGKSLNINTAASDNTSVVSATSSASAKAGTYKVNVSKMAEQAKIEGTSNNAMVKITTPIDPLNWQDKTLAFNDKSGDTSNNVAIKISSSITDANKDGKISTDELVSDINKQIANSTLNGKISASYVSDGPNDYIKFTKSASATDTIKLNATNIGGISELPINSDVSSSSLLTSLGFKAKDDTKNETGLISFALTNGTTSSAVSFTVNNSSTVQDLMDAVNSATSGAVTMSIDDNTGKISFQSKGYGSSSNISITDTSTGNNDISKLGISTTTYTGIMKSTDSTNISSTSPLTSLGFKDVEGDGDISFNLTDGTTSFNVSLKATSTVDDLKKAVNDVNSPVKMSVDDNTGKISFESKNNPASNIKITNTSTDANNNILTKLGLTEKTDTGTDALVSITAPGQSAITTTQSSNNFTLNGVTYNLVGVTAADGKASNVTVTANSDTVVNNMKDFIKDYNSVIDTINTKLTEKKDSGYPPLTDAQKQSMSESQITSWEAKAKVGILRNDDYLQSLMTQLRGVFSAPVYSSYDKNNTSAGKISLSFGQYGSNAIGIDTSTDVTDGGKLVLKDESKLKSAIENNLDDFKKLFIGASTATLNTNETYTGSEKYNEDGIFKRMDTILRDYVAAPGLGDDGTYSLSGSMNIFVNKQYNYSSYGSSSKNTLPDQVYAQTVNVTKFETQLKDAQTRYYAKFTALETAMNSLNSQQSSLTSMLGTS